MADIKQIQFKRSNTPGKKPTATQLAEGELAINLRDRTIFTKDDQGLIVDLGFAKGGDISGDVVHTGKYTQTGDYIHNGNTTQTGDQNITGNVTVSKTVKAGKIDGTEYGNINIVSAKPTIKGTTPTGSWEITTENDTLVLPKVKILTAEIAAITGSTQVESAHIELLTIGNIIPVVNGGTGASTADGARTNLVAAKSGVNSDITDLKALQGPLTLGGDPVGSTDATTKRYVDNAIAAGGGGGSGTTLNGVMNYGVGQPSEWPGRAFIPGYAEPLDGQLLERAKRPDLWAFAQLFTPIDDALWLSDVSQRGKYSKGDGSTTFRVPDWNGAQPGSILGVFFRGGNGQSDMGMSKSMAPNITAEWNDTNRAKAVVTASGATRVMPSASSPWTGGVMDTRDYMKISFDASRESDVYKNGVSEIVPNKVSGVWIVRASGGFTATDTSWSVMNSVANATSGQIVLGGKIISYAKANEKVTTTSMETEQAVDLKAAIRFSINNPNGTTTVWRMEETSWPVNTVANGGTNTNITGLTALQGPLRLGGDATTDYEAVTLRQLRATGGGSGATMTGVMNNGICAVEWFMGTRAKLWAGYEASDGQLVQRSKYPDVVAAMKSGFVNVVDKGIHANSDAAWVAQPNQRGKYSWGDGDETTGTTIRLPDLNGKWEHPTDSALNSVAGLFLRGDGRIGKGNDNNETGGIGEVRRSGVPNIKGSLSILGNGTVNSHLSTDWGEGALYTKQNNAGGSTMNAYTINNNANVYQGGIGLDAKLHSGVYDDRLTEVRPNSVQGIWVIRVSGAFSAAGTEFRIITGDATAPSQGTRISGGKLISEYQIAGKTHVSSRFSVAGDYLNDAWALTELVNAETGVVATSRLTPGSRLHLETDLVPGQITFGGRLNSTVKGGSRLAIYSQTEINGDPQAFFLLGKDNDSSYANRVMSFNSANDLVLNRNPLVTGATRGGAFSSRAYDRYMNILTYDTPGVDGGAVMEVGHLNGGLGFFFFSSGDGNKVGKILSSQRGLVVFEGSDATWKENIVDAKPGALDRVMLMRQREYNWIEGGEHERGWIAQEMRLIDEEYVSEANGKLSVKTKAIISDLIGSVQTLKGEIEVLKAKLAAK